MSRFITVLLLVVVGGTFQPAGADESDLAGTAWLVDDIGGRGVIDRARTTLQFLEPGRVAGHTGCNRYFGPVELDGDRTSFGNLGVTRMACAEALMNQEQRFLEALVGAERLEFEHEGRTLVLYDDGGRPVLRLSRIVEK